MVLLTSLAFVLALIAGGWLVRRLGMPEQPYAPDKPQRFHEGEVSRLGGVAVGVGVMSAWLLGTLLDGPLLKLNLHLSTKTVLLCSLAIGPALTVGVLEDLTQRISVSARLLATLASGSLLCWALGLSIHRLDIAWFDAGLRAWPWVGVALAVLALTGLPHAFNIIDGYNGLAGMVAMLIALAMAHVALQVGDRAVAALMMALAGATAGFLVWNYPRGLIFAGDGGAYLWGVVIALGAVLLVQRNPQVSPWFPPLLLIYPVWETVFSIYRKAARGRSPGLADALHFHQLIFRRLVRGVFHDGRARQLLIRNNRTSPYLWGFTAMSVLPAVLFWKSSLALILCCVLFAVCYVLAYLAIVRFKIPNWLRH
ncbi:MraY family glycosyltransferase [Curvibacter lanceolatus]|jgi:UDP-GlcNAc:undecaprenyl-phosphate/decaprenyl-phosphate GlcNAc-1-phosphate transferase|uniref:MraY family glycosyltransferase n=1 Tax=Curvibacter lanceolatus TaxID=86182 RepID=UPI00037F41D1|nr:glycosyltransferase [Curvibacter lanceolatus]